jgi:hypothetical protein
MCFECQKKKRIAARKARGEFQSQAVLVREATDDQEIRGGHLSAHARNCD